MFFVPKDGFGKTFTLAKSDVLTAMAVNSAIFWSVAPCNLIDVEHTASIFRVEEKSEQK
jgi:hypothetical protein